MMKTKQELTNEIERMAKRYYDLKNGIKVYDSPHNDFDEKILFTVSCEYGIPDGSATHIHTLAKVSTQNLLHAKNIQKGLQLLYPDAKCEVTYPDLRTGIILRVGAEK